MEAGKDLIPAFGADTLGIGVLSRVGLKPEDPKENETAGAAMGDAAGVGASEALGGAKEKAGTPEPRVGLSGASPAPGADNFKEAEPKENTAGAPPAGGTWKVAVGAAGAAAGAEAGDASAEVSTFGGVWEEVGVVGVLPATKNKKGEKWQPVHRKQLTNG